MRKVIALMWIVLLIGMTGAIRPALGNEEPPTLCNSLVCIQFDEYISQRGLYEGKIDIFKVDLNENGNPKDDPNLFFGDLRGWQALRLVYKNCWAQINGNYDVTSSKVIFTRNNTDAGVKERVEYALNSSKTMFYIKPTVTILSPREDDIRYGLTFISDIYVTSDPGETIYVKGFGIDGKYIDSNDPQTVYNWAKQHRFETTIEEGKFTSGYVTSVIVPSVHLVYMKIERPDIGTYYLGIVSKEPRYASIITASAWAHTKGIYFYLGTPNNQLNTGETLSGEFAFVYAKTRDKLFSMANAFVNPPSQPKTVQYLTPEDLSKWKYYREVTIKEQSGETLENFQVLITLNSTNFDFSKALPDGSDIRIVDGNGNFLPYWIEEWNVTAKRAKIWTIVPSIPANGEVKLRLYYGNPTAESRSDGDKVFEFFDDFNENQLNTSKWEIVPGDNEEQYLSDGFYYYHSPYTYDNTGGIVTKSAFESKNSVIIGTKVYFDSGWDGIVNLIVFSENPMPLKINKTIEFFRNRPLMVLIEHNWGGDENLEISLRNGDTSKTYKIAPLLQSSWNTYELALNFKDKTVDYVKRDNKKYNAMVSFSGIAEDYYHILLGFGRGITSKFDYIYVRKYASKDPITIVGSEHLSSGGGQTTHSQTQTPLQTSTTSTVTTTVPQTSTLAPVAKSEITGAESIISKVPSNLDLSDAKSMLDEAKKAYDNGDYELAKKFAETAQALAVKAYYDKLRTELQVKESQGENVEKARELLQRAYNAYNEKDYTKALDILAQADLVLQGVQPSRKFPYYLLLLLIGGVLVGGVAYSHKRKGEAERLKAEFESLVSSGDNIVEKDQFGALEYYSKAFSIANRLKDPTLIRTAQEKLNTVRGTVIAEINSLVGRGDDSLEKSDYDRALAYYRQALNLAEKLGDESRVKQLRKKVESVDKIRKIRELISEGDVLMEGEKYSLAKEKYTKALELAKEIGNEYFTELLKSRIAKVNEAIDSINREVSSLMSRANALLAEEDYDGAIDLLSQALALAEKIGGTVSVDDIRRTLEEAKLRKALRDKLAEAGKSDPATGLGILAEAMELAKKLNDEREIAGIRSKIEELQRTLVLETLKNGVKLLLPKELPYGKEVTMTIEVENKLQEPIENLTVDLSELSPYFTLSEQKVTFPLIKPGRKLGKDVLLTPKFKGDFDFNVVISSNIGDTVKSLSVKVGDYYSPTHFTPRPLTPKAAPEELEALYEDFQYIGEGGFARVFRARRKRDGKVVAVKIPKTLDPATGKAFVREISNWLHLKHRNIVELYDVNVIPIPYLEMEYCEGSLAKLGKPMEVEKAASIIFNIAEGLKYAHSKGVIHRDLKPSNVLLKAGIPKISDWGLSKVMSESRSSTISSFTPFYAAPEQLSPRHFGHTDGRTDIWQLGVLFYELVTGKLPFEGKDLGEVTFAIINEDPTPPSQLNPEAKIVEPMIMKMLVKRKEERYQSIEELQRDLARVLNMTYVEGLKKSRDLKRTVFYIGDLALINLKAGNLKEALKYLLELREYAGKYREDLDWLISQVKLAMEEGVKLGEDAIAKADVIVHQIKMGR